MQIWPANTRQLRTRALIVAANAPRANCLISSKFFTTGAGWCEWSKNLLNLGMLNTSVRSVMPETESMLLAKVSRS